QRVAAPIVCFAIGGVPCHPLLGLQSTGSHSSLCRSSSSSSLGSASNSLSAIAVSVRSLPRYSSLSASRHGPIRFMIPLRTRSPCSVHPGVAKAEAIGNQNPSLGQRPVEEGGSAWRRLASASGRDVATVAPAHREALKTALEIGVWRVPLRICNDLTTQRCSKIAQAPGHR